MRHFNLLLSVMAISFLFGCSNEPLNEDQANLERRRNDVKLAAQSETTFTSNDDVHCFETTLVAGQHHEAGLVTVDIEGDYLIITYSSNGDWEIGTTHLSIGNCDENWAPLTGSGNPKVGHFEYTEPYSYGPYEVVYMVSLEGLDDHYCFAAHAEVVGPSGGETAWADGSQFDGNGWAMYVESYLSDCQENNGGNGPY
ncbi:hypothetical protein AB9K26_13665 [Psychroserpens sp. XS_ASV72]|uniref:hypothetical protein n=1 Tax=Psychroserpens sp. XS_ASV72 TaxID=3241293 RepID=UPI0035196E88